MLPLPLSSQSDAPRTKVLHVEAGLHMHGGAEQVFQLIHGLARHQVDSVLVCSQGSDIAQALRGTACTVYETLIRGELDWTLATRIVQVIRIERPSLVHLHSRRGADLFGGMAGRWGNVPVILSRRVDTAESRLLSPIKYRLFDRVVAISECIERVLREAGVPASKLRCVHSGIDPEPYRKPADRAWVANEFGLAADDLLVGMIAQFIPRKGHMVLLDALNQLKAAYPRLRVLMFGQGPLVGQVREEIASRGLESHAIIGGFRRDLPRIVPAFDFVVHPAFAEGLGVALIQAAAAGVPMIGSRAGGIPEIVRHEETGLLVEPKDVAGLTAAIRRLADDAPLRRRLGEAGKKLVDREFSNEQMVRGNLAVYRELLAERASLRQAG